jgi:hypothetical protein
MCLITRKKRNAGLVISHLLYEVDNFEVKMLKPSRYSQPTLIIIIAIVLCIMAVGVFAGVFALVRRNQGPTILRVPDNYPTIQAALDAADTGDIIQVRPGIYSENIVLNKAVTLTAETFDQVNPVNNTTVIDGMGGTAAIMIPAGLTQMPVIHGFVIQNSVNGIQSSSEFIAEFNLFHSSANLTNYQMGAGGVNRNNVYFNSSDDAIHIEDVNRPLLIEYNRILYAGDDGIEISLQNTSIPPALIEVDIWNNMILGSREDGIQFIDYTNDPLDTNRRFVIAGNLIANSAKAGIGLMPSANTIEDYSGADVLEAIRLFNNTLYGNNHGISGGDNLVVINSIIVNSPGRGVWRIQGEPGSNSVVAYTLFHNNALDADQSTLGPGIITGQDPLFQAAPNPGPDGAWGTVDDDFSGLLLQASSPAIDKGVPQYVATNGEAVPLSPITGFLGTAPDLGWREFGSPAIITPTVTPLPSVTLPPGVIPASPVPSATLTFTPLPTASPSATPTLVPTITSTLVTPASPVPSSTFTPPPTATATTVITPTPQLTIAGIVPNSAKAGTTVNLTISGTGFMNGATVLFEREPATGTAPVVTAVQVLNHTSMQITVNIPAAGASGPPPWNVRVTNPNSATVALVGAFTVNP